MKLTSYLWVDSIGCFLVRISTPSCHTTPHKSEVHPFANSLPFFPYLSDSTFFTNTTPSFIYSRDNLTRFTYRGYGNTCAIVCSSPILGNPKP